MGVVSCRKLLRKLLGKVREKVWNLLKDREPRWAEDIPLPPKVSRLAILLQVKKYALAGKIRARAQR
jgi:hypothetical protein